MKILINLKKIIKTRKEEEKEKEMVCSSTKRQLNLWNPVCPAYDFCEKAKIFQSPENKS